MVLGCHHIYTNPNAGAMTHYIGALFGAGGGGVVLFFAMSGFLIAWPFWKRKFGESKQVVPRGYAKRRFWKIYPPLALSVVLLAPVYVYLNRDSVYFTIAGEWLAGIPFLWPVSGKLNPVMWTLVIEAQFYVSLPLVFLALKKVPAKVCLWLIPAIYLAVPVTYRVVTGLAPTFSPMINAHFPSALDAFFLGILVAGLDTGGLLKKKWARLGMIGLVLWPMAVLVAGWTRSHADTDFSGLETVESWMEKIGSGCLLFYAANPTTTIPRLLCWPALRWCGIVSYEWYLFHQPIVLWARSTIGSAGGKCFSLCGNSGRVISVERDFVGVGLPVFFAADIAVWEGRWESTKHQAPSDELQWKNVGREERKQGEAKFLNNALTSRDRPSAHPS